MRKGMKTISIIIEKNSNFFDLIWTNSSNLISGDSFGIKQIVENVKYIYMESSTRENLILVSYKWL